MSTESNEQPEARELPPLEHEDHRGYMFRYTPEVSQLRRYLEQLPTEWLASLGVQRLAPSGEKPSEAKLIIGALRRYALPDKNDEDGTWFGMGWNACRREVVRAIDAVEVIALHVAAPPPPTPPASGERGFGSAEKPDEPAFFDGKAWITRAEIREVFPPGDTHLVGPILDALEAAEAELAKLRPPEPSGEELARLRATIARVEAQRDALAHHGGKALRLAESAMSENDYFCEETEAFSAALTAHPSTGGSENESE